jgi:hypothetical protein
VWRARRNGVRNVLALRKLEDVLLAIDDLEGAVGLHLADVAAVKPPVVLQHLRPAIASGQQYPLKNWRNEQMSE